MKISFLSFQPNIRLVIDLIDLTAITAKRASLILLHARLHVMQYQYACKTQTGAPTKVQEVICRKYRLNYA